MLPELPSKELLPLHHHWWPLLPHSLSSLFTKQLYTCTLLETILVSIQFKSQQPGCLYTPIVCNIKDNFTSNLWKYLERVHPIIYHPVKQSSIDSYKSSRQSITSAAIFFTPRLPTSTPHHALYQSKKKCRELLRSFLVNNLSLRLVENSSFHFLIIHELNPTILTISHKSIMLK